VARRESAFPEERWVNTRGPSRWVGGLLGAARVAGVLVVALLALIMSARPTTESRAPVVADVQVMTATKPYRAKAAAPVVASYRSSAPVLRAPRPVRIEIPSIGVQTHIVALGLETDGTMEVPSYENAGWYEGGARPGENGPAVIAAHVDSTTGPAVFYRLHELLVGDAVVVTRRDGSVARFVVDRLERHSKDAFPTQHVYGPTPGPTLRLVTCGGAFDETQRSYVENLVAFASPAK
jgi:sortase (surface protein transpeptidase)